MNTSNPERDRMWLLAQELMLAAGRDGTIVATNPHWAQLLGWDEAELQGTNFFELVHPDERAMALEAAAQLMPGNAAIRLDNRCRHKDGSYRSISWTAVPDGQRLYAIGREQATDTLHAQNINEQKVDALGRFAGVIAHDFNNVLQGIVGSMELIRKLIKLNRAEETERFLGTAMSSAKRAAALTERLQAFASRSALDAKPVEVNQLIDSMQDTLKEVLAPVVNVERRLSAGVWSTLCDAKQLENAILHLVTNSRDAMPGGGTIAIETSNASIEDTVAIGLDPAAGGQYVCIAVTDSGTGMTAEMIRQAFDPLFTTKKTGLVSGLGLSTVHGFTRQARGHVKIFSEPGRGCTVRLYLPRHLEAA